MPSTYTPIVSTTVGSTTGTVSFTSISAVYTDIVVVVNATASGNFGLWYRVNNDSSTNYSYVEMLGNGSIVATAAGSSETRGLAANNVDATISTNIIQFMNYSNTTTHKIVLSRGSAPSQTSNAIVSTWASTPAINRIDFAVGGSFPSGDFVVGATITLYGIKAA